jgi:hypothetical protein
MASFARDITVGIQNPLDMKMEAGSSKHRQDERAIADMCDSAQFRTFKGSFVKVLTIVAAPLVKSPPCRSLISIQSAGG